jgi:hypothetical protein
VAATADPGDEGTRSKSGKQDVGLTPHPIIARLLNESGEPLETVVVEGFLGEVDSRGFVRIYLDLKLQAYIEVDKNRIKYVQPSDKSDETRPTRIIVDVEGPLDLVQTVDASFLKGSIVSATSITPPPKTVPFGFAPGGFGLVKPSPCTTPTPPHPSVLPAERPLSSLKDKE